MKIECTNSRWTEAAVTSWRRKPRSWVGDTRMSDRRCVRNLASGGSVERIKNVDLFWQQHRHCQLTVYSDGSQSFGSVHFSSAQQPSRLPGCLTDWLTREISREALLRMRSTIGINLTAAPATAAEKRDGGGKHQWGEQKCSWLPIFIFSLSVWQLE